MLGILDRAYIALRGTDEVDLDGYDITPGRIDRESQDVWFCFLPEVAKGMKGFTPKSGKVISYYLPREAVYSHPQKMRDLLSRIVDDSQSEIESLGVDPIQLNFLGVSLGSVIPFFLIGNFGYAVNRLVAITPASNIADCAMSSISTKKRRQKMIEDGSNPAEAYEGHLGIFSSINHAGKIDRATTVDCHIAGQDLIVPGLYGYQLVHEMRRNGQDPRVVEYPRSGHVAAI